jgi:hypothetical protein
VSTRRFGRAVRLPGGDISAAKGTGVSKSAVSLRRGKQVERRASIRMRKCRRMRDSRRA